MDQRAVIDDGKLLAGSVRAVGDFRSGRDDPNWGNVELAVHDLATGDGGATWQWQPITANSTADNLRPVVPKWDDPRTVLVWMRGRYVHNRGEWATKMVATVLP